MRSRCAAGSETRFERMDQDFHERLRWGFLDIAREAPERCVVIDGHGTAEEVHRAMLAALRERLGVAVG